jgi:hypothetical protein
LKTHTSFIYRSSAGDIFNKKKRTLKDNEALTLMDFAKNYGFMVQDESQGFHWNNDSCTLHPALLYYKKKMAAYAANHFAS